MNRPLTAPASDIALVLMRVIFAVVMIAHGYQKLFLQGLGQTTVGFEKLSIPLAIVSAAFVTVMELAGALMVLAGAMTTIVSALFMVEFVGAIVFVHGEHGLFVANGGAEYVMIICALLLAMVAMGPGRYSVDSWVRGRARRRERELAHVATAPVLVTPPFEAAPSFAPITYQAVAPSPVVLPAPFAPGPDEIAPSVPAPASAPIFEPLTGQSGPLPVRRPRTAHASH